MPTDLPIQPQDWSALTPLGVCLGLLVVTVLGVIPFMWWDQRKERREWRKEIREVVHEFRETINKQAQFNDDQSKRGETERQRILTECVAERKQDQQRHESERREWIPTARRRGG